MHWPICLNPKGNHPNFPTRPDGTRDVLTDWPISKTWEQMEALVKKGKVRSIGVSNCSEKILEQLLPHATIVPAVDQVRSHLTRVSDHPHLPPYRTARIASVQPATRTPSLFESEGHRCAGVFAAWFDKLAAADR